VLSLLTIYVMLVVQSRQQHTKTYDNRSFGELPLNDYFKI